MSEKTPPLLKDKLDTEAIEAIARAGTASSARFDRDRFLAVAGAGLADLSIMERVRHVADALVPALPQDYPAAIEIVRAMGSHLSGAFQAIAVTEFVARHGLGHFDISMAALADLTRFGSAEFAVRPFLAAEPARALAVMQGWAESPDPHVRRLASEGSRPRLPWATRIPALQADPTLGAPILEVLKADDSPYVRKSVANHLNDIAKDVPAWVVARLGTWSQDEASTRWIVRHALRTLIKQGDAGALALIGANHGAEIAVRRFAVSPDRIRLGGDITLSAELMSTAPTGQRLVVDYRIDYARSGGRRSAKVFKFKTFDLAAGDNAILSIRQVIRDFSTRRHHSGVHAVDLLVNGKTVASSQFVLESRAD